MQQLKIALQALGPLRPAAWESIARATQLLQLKENENLIRRADMVAFLVSGLLKEYDARQRKRPSIINFIPEGNFLITRKFNEANFIKACCPSVVYLMEWAQLQSLYQQYNELKQIYDGLSERYDISITYRQMLLEEKVSGARISMFIHSHRLILPMVKKKDIANYLHLAYDHFVRQYSKLL